MLRNIQRQLVSKKVIAARYNISPRTVSNFMARRILPHVKIGRIVRFDIEKCDQSMAAFETQSIAAVCSTTSPKPQHSAAQNN